MKINYEVPDTKHPNRTICYLEEEIPNADPRAIIAAFDPMGMIGVDESSIEVINDEQEKD